MVLARGLFSALPLSVLTVVGMTESGHPGPTLLWAVRSERFVDRNFGTRQPSTRCCCQFCRAIGIVAPDACKDAAA